MSQPKFQLLKRTKKGCQNDSIFEEVVLHTISHNKLHELSIIFCFNKKLLTIEIPKVFGKFREHISQKIVEMNKNEASKGLYLKLKLLANTFNLEMLAIQIEYSVHNFFQQTFMLAFEEFRNCSHEDV